MDKNSKVANWLSEIKLGKEWRYLTSGREDKNWERYKNYYRGSWWDRTDSILGNQNKDYIPVNWTFSYIRGILPVVYFRNPGIVVVEGKTVNGVDDGPALQELINYLLRELRLKRTIKKAVLDTLLYGIGVMKVGFGSEQTVGEAQVVGDKKISYHRDIKNDVPWVINVNPASIIIPYGTTNINNAPWMVHEVDYAYEDVMENPLYKHKDKIRAVKKYPIMDRKKKYHIGELSGNKPLNRVQLYEIHDKRTSEMWIISESSDKPHYTGPMLNIDNFPFHFMVFDEDPDTAWGISAIKILEPQQLEINTYRTMQAAHYRRESTKFLVDPKAASDEDLEKLMADLNDASQPMAALVVNNPGQTISTITASAPPDLLAASRATEDDFRTSLGFSRNQMGEVSTGRRTAEEIATVRQSSELRMKDRRDVAVDVFEDIVHDLLFLSFQYVPVDLAQKITKGKLWHTRNELREKYELKFAVEEVEPASTDSRRQESTQLYQILAGSPVANPLAAITELLRSYGKTPEEYIDPEIARIVYAVMQQRAQQQKQQQEGGGA